MYMYMPAFFVSVLNTSGIRHLCCAFFRSVVTLHEVATRRQQPLSDKVGNKSVQLLSI